MKHDHGLSRVRAALAGVDAQITALNTEASRRAASAAAEREAVTAAQAQDAAVRLACTQAVTAGMAAVVADAARKARGPFIEIKRGDLVRRAQALQHESETLQRDGAAAEAEGERMAQTIQANAGGAMRDLQRRGDALNAERDALLSKERDALEWIRIDSLPGSA